MKNYYPLLFVCMVAGFFFPNLPPLVFFYSSIELVMSIQEFYLKLFLKYFRVFVPLAKACLHLSHAQSLNASFFILLDSHSIPIPSS